MESHLEHLRKKVAAGALLDQGDGHRDGNQRRSKLQQRPELGVVQERVAACSGVGRGRTGSPQATSRNVGREM